MQYIVCPVSTFVKDLMMAHLVPKHVAVNKLINPGVSNGTCDLKQNSGK
jgi:hypothetical protein